MIVLEKVEIEMLKRDLAFMKKPLGMEECRGEEVWISSLTGSLGTVT